MKFEIPKEWMERKAKEEAACGADCTTGIPPTPRDMWLAEVRHLLVTKYALKWPAEEVAEYAESLAGHFYDDADWRVKPDEAIDEDFRAGL